MTISCSAKRIGELQLNVAESDSAETTLLMLHGVTRRWQTFLPIAAPLALRHRLMLVDFRGHGLSDRADSGYKVVDYIDDICERLTEHIDARAADDDTNDENDAD